MKPELLSISGGCARQGLRYYFRVEYVVAAPFGRTMARRVPYQFASGYAWRRKTALRKLEQLKSECYDKLAADPRVNVGPKEPA